MPVAAFEGRHYCESDAEYMGAVDWCGETEDGRLAVGNGEYGSLVNFCPFCGRRAPTPSVQEAG